LGGAIMFIWLCGLAGDRAMSFLMGSDQGARHDSGALTREEYEALMARLDKRDSDTDTDDEPRRRRRRRRRRPDPASDDYDH
ncbi:MAG TPA: SHOCT domain-containing protein, partial [Alicycliphilus sp.]|nr:SHOCT domain-containing protein [Alicycliphilus sp.]